MDTLIILLAQTKGEAIIEILSLLLVAAIIGFITAWLYYKSVYIKRIKDLQTENEALNYKIVGLNADKSNLHKNLLEKDNAIEHFMKEVNALKALQAKDVVKTEDMTLKDIRTEKMLNQKDAELVYYAQRKHLLDYNSFGTATEAEKDDLKMISGIGPFIEERLHAIDIYTFRQISKFTPGDIDAINDAIIYFAGRIERDEWIAQAKELVYDAKKRMEFLERIRERKARIYYDRIGIAHKGEADDLTVISGIGGWISEKLNVLDIYTYRQISNFTDEDVYIVTEAIEYFPGRIERDEWIIQAQELVKTATKKSELLVRIRERKGRIYYDRLGVAHRHHANNLTFIKGIGLWIEERLNLLDIYTFEQICKLTPPDIETISEILGISPERIDRENWVLQARGLAKRQLHAEEVLV